MDNKLFPNFIFYIIDDHSARTALQFYFSLYAGGHRLCINSYPQDYNYTNIRLKNYFDLTVNTMQSLRTCLSTNFFFPTHIFEPLVPPPSFTILSHPIDRISYEFLIYQRACKQSPFISQQKTECARDIRIFSRELDRCNIITRLFSQTDFTSDLAQSQFELAHENISKLDIIGNAYFSKKFIEDVITWLSAKGSSFFSNEEIIDAHYACSTKKQKIDEFSFEINNNSTFINLDNRPTGSQVQSFIGSLDTQTKDDICEANQFDLALFDTFTKNEEK